MTREETKQVMTIIGVAYPNFYKSSEDAVKTAAIDLWQQMFADTPLEKVKVAVIAHIANSKFAPTIAEIKDYIAKMNMPDLPSALEAWQSVRKAIQRGEYMQGGYDYGKAFNALPALVRRIVGDKYQLRIWGQMEEIEFEQFEKPRFIANYEKQAKSQAEFGRLPGVIQAETARLSEKNAVPLDGLLAEAKRRAGHD